jgi:hypothetical protein
MSDRRLPADQYGALRKRMIHETEVALIFGLRFPDRVPRIPTIEVGTGEFHPEFAKQYWDRLLDSRGLIPIRRDGRERR